MKLFKRLTALVLSVVMMLSMGVSAFATEGESSIPSENVNAVSDEGQVSYTWKDNSDNPISNPTITQGKEIRVAPFNGDTNLFAKENLQFSL